MPIFDQGYQHWSGELTSHTWRWLAIARHGVRIGMKNRLLRILMLLAWAPAVLLAASLCLWGLVEQKSELVTPLGWLLEILFSPEVMGDPKSFRLEVWTRCFANFIWIEQRFAMVVVLLVGPSLISRDLRFNALPLYFSRPVRRIDYFLGKLGIVCYFLGMVLIVPAVIGYVLGVIFSLDISIIPDTITLLLAAVGYGAAVCLSAGLLILALSSLSRNSRYVGLFWLAIWFVTAIVGESLETANQVHRQQRGRNRQAADVELARQHQPMPKMTPEERQKWAMAEDEARRSRRAEVLRDEIEAGKSDWRPLLSYSANLSRIGQQWLRTDRYRIRLSENMPEEQRDEYLLEHLGAQYPWYWSAIVLLVLFGISVCILNFRVKSLDRLK
jgi:ABC-2 type transport system permease protein